MASYFQFTPADYTPSMPSPTGRLDVTFNGGIGSLDAGRIPIYGGASRRHSKRHSKKHTKRHSKKHSKKHPKRRHTRKHTRKSY